MPLNTAPKPSSSCRTSAVLLENLRFHAEEEGSYKDADGKKVKADKTQVDEFRRGLTALGDIYISMYPLLLSAVFILKMHDASTSNL